MVLTKKFHCPRCKNEKIIDYGESFDCPICRLEFEKKDFDKYDEENILSVEEKMDLVKAITEMKKE